MINVTIDGEQCAVKWKYGTQIKEAGHGEFVADVTVVELYNEKHELLDEAVIARKYDEKYDKDKARRYSLEKLLKGYDKETRTAVWNAYNNRPQLNKLRNQTAPMG